MARSYTNPAPGPIGSTFTAAGGQANNKLYVAANGQSLLRSAYPELAGSYSDQSPELVGSASSVLVSWSGGNMPIAQPLYRMCYDTTSTYAVFAQTIYWNSTYGVAFWSTTDAENWKLLDFFIDGGYVLKVVAIGSDVYICTTVAMYKITNNTTVTKVYNSVTYDICTNGTTFFIVTGGNAVSTTDFVSFTPVSTGHSPYGCVFFGGNYWSFQGGSTTIRYSSDLVTWTAAPITTGLALDSNYVRVVNGQIVIFPNSNGSAIFTYNASPLVTGWTNSSQTYASGTHGSVTGFFYDSGTTEYILTVGRTSTVLAYKFTTIAGSSSSVSSSSTTSASNDTLAVRFGSVYTYHIADQYSIKGTSWLTGNNSINGSTAIQNPFFTSGSAGYTKGGTTLSGNRWLNKPCGSTGATVYQGFMVEENGVFKQLYTSSTNPWPFTTATSPQQWCVFYQDSNGYAAIVGTSGSGTYYYASFTTARVVLTASASSTPSANQQVFIPVKDRGIELFPTPSASSRQTYLFTTTSTSAPATGFSYTLNTTSTMTCAFNSYVTGETIFTELNATATTTPSFYVIKNGSVIFNSNTFTLFNTSGSSVSVSSSCKIVKFGGTYYAYQGGTIYASTNGTTFNQVGTGSSTPNGMIMFTEFKSNVALGSFKSFVNFGTPSLTQISSQTSSQGSMPDFFRVNGSLSVGSYQDGGTTYGYLYSTPFDTTVSFLVPSISSSTAGQGVYIVAR